MTDLRPPPDRSRSDRGLVFDENCLVDQTELGLPRCVYGKRRSKTRVVLLGDSHAMHYAPALRAVARQRGWQLQLFTRAGCTIASVKFSYRCDTWRRAALRRIKREVEPDLVVAGSATRYRVVRNGRRWSRKRSQKPLTRGQLRTFKGLRARRIRVVALKETSRAPDDVPSCVIANPTDFGACAFELPKRFPFAHMARAAKRMRGVRLLEPEQALCPDRVCPAVVGDVLVYRDRHHLTATFAQTLAPWFDARLPRLDRPLGAQRGPTPIAARTSASVSEAIARARSAPAPSAASSAASSGRSVA